jgi:hypothetical protein
MKTIPWLKTLCPAELHSCLCGMETGYSGVFVFPTCGVTSLSLGLCLFTRSSLISIRPQNVFRMPNLELDSLLL